MSITGTSGALDEQSGELVARLPDLTAVSLEQARSLDATVLSHAVRRVIDEADAGLGHHLSSYNPSAYLF